MYSMFLIYACIIYRYYDFSSPLVLFIDFSRVELCFDNTECPEEGTLLSRELGNVSTCI